MISLGCLSQLGMRVPRRTAVNNYSLCVFCTTQDKRSSCTMLSKSSFVQIVEVGPRDGLQNEAISVSVPDKWVPAMGNSSDVMNQLSGLRREKGKALKLSALVPSYKYFQPALDSVMDEIAIFASASETFSQKNINCSIEESIDRFKPVLAAAKTHNIPVRGYLSCVIACPYEGAVKPHVVGRWTEKLLDMGCFEVSLGDTIGVGTPATTVAMLDAALVASGGRPDLLAAHYHDTYGQALANLLVSLERGIATIDSSVAGLGGCPYAKGASGNVATEDVVYMLNGLGVETGINMDRLADTGQFICEVLGRRSSSKAGIAHLAAHKKVS